MIQRVVSGLGLCAGVLAVSGCMWACARAGDSSSPQPSEGVEAVAPAPAGSAAGAHTRASTSGGRSAPAASEGTEPARLPLKWGVVTLPDRRHGPSWRVEIAAAEHERARGLMYRRSLAEDRGMIFLMPGDHDWAFYMRNTYIPLDMVFIDRDWRVVGVQANTRPLTETLRRGGAPCRYVLELAAHQARKHGIRSGTRLALRADADAGAP